MAVKKNIIKEASILVGVIILCFLVNLIYYFFIGRTESANANLNIFQMALPFSGADPTSVSNWRVFLILTSYYWAYPCYLLVKFCFLERSHVGANSKRAFWFLVCVLIGTMLMELGFYFSFVISTLRLAPK